jgi:hypothetical protein
LIALENRHGVRREEDEAELNSWKEESVHLPKGEWNMQIAKTMAEATPALDFNTPLQSGDPRWTDFSRARGGDEIGRIRRLFERPPQNQWLHVVFASHRGAGKTTELNRLAADLETKYHPVYFVANNEMDAIRFEMEDLLLVIARVIEEKMREKKTPLNPDLLKKIEEWFSTVIFSDEQGKSFLGKIETEAKAEGGIPFFAKLMASVTASLKVESEHRESVKRTLKKFPGTLMTHVNNLLNAAGEILRKEGKRLLLLIDNMDRYEPKVVDELLVQSADRFKSLRCDLIVTPPIGLVLRPESQTVDSVFRCETMPTIRLREKTDGYDKLSDPGRGCLLEALRKRVDLDKLISDTKARERLVFASGGAIRELLYLAQDATLEASGETITLENVNSVLNRRRQQLRDRVDANGYWDTLNRIAGTKRLGKDRAFLDVLYHHLAFQYNGEVWYDVHPLITELPDFKPAREEA